MIGDISNIADTYIDNPIKCAFSKFLLYVKLYSVSVIYPGLIC